MLESRIRDLESELDLMRSKYVAVCEERDQLRRCAEEEGFIELLQSHTKKAVDDKYSQLSTTLMTELEGHKRLLASEGVMGTEFVGSRMQSLRSLVQRDLSSPIELQNAVLLLRNEVSSLTQDKRDLARKLTAQSMDLRKDIQNFQSQHNVEVDRYKTIIASMEKDSDQAHKIRLAIKAAKGWRRSLTDLREDLFTIRHSLMQYKSFAFGGGAYSEAPLGRLGGIVRSSESNSLTEAAPSGGGVAAVLGNAFAGIAAIQQANEEDTSELKEAFDMLTRIIQNRCRRPVADTFHFEVGSRPRSRQSPNDLSSPGSGRASPLKATLEPQSKSRRRTISRSIASPLGSTNSFSGKRRRKSQPANDLTLNVNFTAFGSDQALPESASARADQCVGILMEYCDAMEECWNRQNEIFAKSTEKDSVSENFANGLESELSPYTKYKTRQSPFAHRSQSIVSPPQSIPPTPTLSSPHQRGRAPSVKGLASQSPIVHMLGAESRLTPQISQGKIKIGRTGQNSFVLPRGHRTASVSGDAHYSEGKTRRETVVTIASTPKVTPTENKGVQTSPPSHATEPNVVAAQPRVDSPKKVFESQEVIVASRAPSSFRSTKKTETEDAQSICMSLVELTFPQFPKQSGTNTVGHILKPVAKWGEAPEKLRPPPVPAHHPLEGLKNPLTRQHELEHKATVVGSFIAMRKCFRRWMTAHQHKQHDLSACPPQVQNTSYSSNRTVVSMHVASFAPPSQSLLVAPNARITRPSTAPNRRRSNSAADGASLAYRPQLA